MLSIRWLSVVDMSSAGEGFPSHQHVVFELTLPGLPAHCRESKQLMEEDVVLVMFTQSLNTWVSLVFQRDVTMSEYNVSVAMIEKTKQSNPKTAVHLVRLQNQS